MHLELCQSYCVVWQLVLWRGANPRFQVRDSAEQLSTGTSSGVSRLLFWLGSAKMDGSPGGLAVGASPEPVSASCPSPAKERAEQLAQLSSCATSIAHTVEMANLFYCSLVSS